MHKAILFDLDGTLHNRPKSLVTFFRDQCERFSMNVDLNRFVELDNEGMRWKDEVYEQLVKEYQLPLDPQQLLADYVTLFPRFAQLYPDVEHTLEQLKAKDYKLGIISNGKKGFQRAVFNSLSINEYFESVIISDEVGLRKPDARIFALGIEQLNVQPEQALYVGDQYDTDIIGSRNKGLKAAWKTNEQVDSDAHFQFSSWRQFIPKLQQLEGETWSSAKQK
ncbi:2-haloalkanoic acid dehalogenase [Geomicrobium sp. JCM 19037]|uniref:HAD family hydrolase n=1 Tax=unclassified Geomicrobium TaxID=2628951 RepID=UPI00045F45A3|nr:HAD family hydrolase [Geomicrobium sp. JCM 19037]GAK02823.1 2-haloalkanoic acid dehalogenase [Geomicrobium sp. JCM 19037]